MAALPRTPRARALAGLGVGLAIAALVHMRAWVFIADDAYIAFRYARNLATHGALEYNLGERVEGYSNLLWVLVLALGDLVGVAPERLAPLLTQASALALVALAVLLLRRLRGRAGAAFAASDLTPAPLLIAAPEVMVWAQSGLETGAAAALVVGAMVAWLAGRLRSAALLAGLAGLCRADALLPIAAFGAAWLVFAGIPGWWARRREGAAAPIPWRGLAGAAAIFALLIGGHFLFRRLYYDALWPNTWTIKAHGALLRGSYGVDYIKAWWAGLGLIYAAPLLPLLRPRHLQVALPALVVVAYAFAVGGDFMAYGRLLIVATVMSAVLVAWLLADAGDALAARWPRLAPTSLVVALALGGVLGVRAHARWTADRATPSAWLDGLWEGVTAMDRFARERVHVGRWMRNNLPEETLITVGAAGALPYASGLPAIDVYGLTDPAVAHLPEVEPLGRRRGRPGHQIVAPKSYLRGRDPDLYCHVGFVGPFHPSTPLARRRGLGVRVVWACVRPGPVADPREPSGTLDLGYYCCVMDAGRQVGPFDPKGERAPE